MGIFSGMSYPIVKTAKGYFPVTTGTNLIKGDLLQLLLTSPGERLMMPQYGTPLRTLLFDPNDTLLADRARQMIIDSITTFEPRVVIDAIEVLSGVDNDFLSTEDDGTNNEQVLGIRIVFRDPQDIQEVQELVLQVPLQTSPTTGSN